MSNEQLDVLASLELSDHQRLQTVNPLGCICYRSTASQEAFSQVTSKVLQHLYQTDE